MKDRKNSWQRVMEGVILNICVICSISCLILHVLDWYNPFMDFMGHAVFIQYGLYLSVFALAVIKFFDGRENIKF